MQQQIAALSEYGSRRPGTFEEIDPNTQVMPGVVYEHRIQTSLGWLVDPVVQGILGLQAAFTGLQVLYYNTNPQTGDIVYQFWYPDTAQVRAMALPLIVVIIAVVLAILAGYIILQKVGIIKGPDLLALIPSMLVTVIGGVVMGVLPGKAKIAGLPVLGIGIFMMLQALGFIPSPPGPEPPPPPPGEPGAYITLIRVD